MHFIILSDQVPTTQSTAHLIVHSYPQKQKKRPGVLDLGRLSAIAKAVRSVL